MNLGRYKLPGLSNMGKEILTTPEAIRAAGRNIAALDTKAFYTGCPSPLSSSDGLTAEGVNEIIEELKTIEVLVNQILKSFPKKLEDVAATLEAGDNAAASQFK